MRPRSLVAYSVPHQAFQCQGCRERAEVPYAVLTCPEAFVSMLESVQMDHADCESMGALAGNLRKFTQGARRHNLLKNGSPFARA